MNPEQMLAQAMMQKPQGGAPMQGGPQMGGMMGIGQDPGAQEAPGSLWQKILALLQSSGQPTPQGAEMLHEALPQPLQIDPALDAQRRKQAMIDQALQGS